MCVFVGRRGAGSNGGRGHWTVIYEQLHRIQVTRGKETFIQNRFDKCGRHVDDEL